MKEKINKNLILVIGIPGSGKTTICTYWAVRQPKIIDVRANYNIKISNFIPLKIEDLEKLNTYKKRNMVIFDEGYTVVDSRNAMSDLNKYISYKTFQSRKTNSRYVFAVQLKGSLDNRLRELAGVVVKCKAVEIGYYYEVYHNIEKNGIRRLIKRKHFIISYKKAEKIYPYFDTTQIVMSRHLQNIVVKNMSAESIVEASKKLAEKMLIIRKTWSLRAVKGYLLENNQSDQFAKPVYYEIEKIILKQKEEKEKQQKEKERLKKLKMDEIQKNEDKIKKKKQVELQKEINYYV